MTLVKKGDLPPGSPVYMEDSSVPKMDLSIITYDPNTAQMYHLSYIDELLQYKNNQGVSWINVNGLKDIESIKHLGELYNIHQLSIEDILHTRQQPKVEIFEKYSFLSVKTIQQEKNFHHKQEKQKRQEQQKEIDEFLIDQISIIIMQNVLITFQEISGDSFDGVRKKILNDTGEIRKMGTDYLAYAIIDAVVDEYFLTINHLEEDIEDIEDRATKTSDNMYIQEIQDTKKYLLHIKRAISPLKDNITAIIRHEKFFQTEALKPFLQDLGENLNHAIITVDNYREWLSNIMDVNLSVLSYQMNKVMKVLATISTIFIPLTFIAGIYGMNFDFMPELQYRFAYPVVLCGMGIIAAIMIIIFKIRRWF